MFIYLGLYVAFNTVQVISRWVVGRAEETSTHRSSGFCTVNCHTTASNYQLYRRCWTLEQECTLQVPLFHFYVDNATTTGLTDVAATSKLGFYVPFKARVISGQVLSIAACGTQTNRGDILWLDGKLSNH